MSRTKYWCFTLNNYTEEEVEKLKQFDCQYLVFGYEIAPDTNTPHLQGFVCMINRKTLKTMKKLLNDRYHLEPKRGTIQEAAEYCKKDGAFFEKGTMPEEQGTNGGQATKRKWEEAKIAAKSGNFEDIPYDLWIRYKKTWLSEYHDVIAQQPMEIRDVDLKNHFIWIYGPTGTGKSHMARALAASISDKPPYLKGLNKWWNGYMGQKVVIIEEASPDTCKYLTSYFKQWCDKWPFTAEVKGGSFDNGIRPEYIIVTSNYSIDQCFPDENDCQPMKRRCLEFEKRDREAWLPISSQHDTQLLPPSPLPLATLPRNESSFSVIIDEGTVM